MKILNSIKTVKAIILIIGFFLIIGIIPTSTFAAPELTEKWGHAILTPQWGSEVTFAVSPIILKKFDVEVFTESDHRSCRFVLYLTSKEIFSPDTDHKVFKDKKMDVNSVVDSLVSEMEVGNKTYLSTPGGESPSSHYLVVTHPIKEIQLPNGRFKSVYKSIMVVPDEKVSLVKVWWDDATAQAIQQKREAEYAKMEKERLEKKRIKQEEDRILEEARLKREKEWEAQRQLKEKERLAAREKMIKAVTNWDNTESK